MAHIVPFPVSIQCTLNTTQLICSMELNRILVLFMFICLQIWLLILLVVFVAAVLCVQICSSINSELICCWS